MLAYHILISLKTRLRRQSDHREWNTVRSLLKTHQRTTVLLTSTDDELIRLRVSGLPEAAQHDIYQKLGVWDRLKRIKTIGNKSL